MLQKCGERLQHLQSRSKDTRSSVVSALKQAQDEYNAARRSFNVSVLCDVIKHLFGNLKIWQR